MKQGIGPTTLRLGALALTGGLVVSACSPSNSGTGAGVAGGEITISGSSTVEPISVRVGEMFAKSGGVLPSVEGPGTGDGFKKFCAGETDISDASRAIKDEEQAACAKAGITFTELRIANDAIAVLTSEKNDSVACLTFEDLYGLVGPQAEGVKTWSDAKAKRHLEASQHSAGHLCPRNRVRYLRLLLRTGHQGHRRGQRCTGERADPSRLRRTAQ